MDSPGSSKSRNLDLSEASGVGDSGIRCVDFSNMMDPVLESSRVHHVADWRSLLLASFDHAMKFYPPQNENGKIVVHPEVIE